MASESFDVVCAWCGAVAHRSAVSGSHGICSPCYESLVGVPFLTAAELDELPFGVIELDANGTVLTYNRDEAALARRDPARVVGRDFFKEVAPCTDVKHFAGRFREFLEQAAPSVAFTFTFEFPHGTTDVGIVFLRSKGSTVFVAVTKRPSALAT
jgi:photoactive yellow protein